MKFCFHTHLALDFKQRLDDFIAEYPDHIFSVVTTRDELYSQIVDSDVLVDHRLTAEILEAAPVLKWFFLPFTGVNSVPWDLLENRGIRVSNNHGNAAIVAERAFALALDAMGRISEFDRGLRRGYWHRNESRKEPFVLWNSLKGKRVAILGVGAIGSHIARYLQPFTSNIIGFRRRLSQAIPPGFRSVTTQIEEALDGADLCFVTLPMTPVTKGIIGENELALLEGGYVVNVSRGDIIRESALYEALRTGSLLGAALDVWYRYPKPFDADQLPSEYPFHRLENLVLSPHAGSHATEGKMGQLEGALENIAALIDTGSPRDVVDPDRGY
jgi:phosphoglycerate dehydrogenase-like enzyme